MLALALVFPLLALRSVIAAPTDLQGTVVRQVSESLRPALQEVANFFNPYHSPSLNQTIISSLVLLLISIYVLCRLTWGNLANESWARYLTMMLYGLISPDFMGFAAWRIVFRDSSLAVAYNKIFPVADKKKAWTGTHVAFLRQGGFVLRDGNKPAKVLGIIDLVRLIKAGNIERPDISRADVLARSIRPAHSRRIATWLFYFSITWFAKKFAHKLPLVVLFVSLYAVLMWRTSLLCATFITGVKEPFAVVLGALEEKEFLVSVESDDSHSQGMLSRALADLDKKESVDETGLFVTEKTDAAQEDAPTGEPPRARTVWQFLVSPFKYSLEVVGALCVGVYASSIVQLEELADIIWPSNPTVPGDYIAMFLEIFLAWIIFARVSWKLPFDIERKIWIVASHFLLLQPLALRVICPQTIRVRVKESIRRVVYFLYSLVYAAARLSILFTALYSIRKAL